MYIKTNRLVIQELNINDKAGYFNCISHDKKVQETFMAKYYDNIDDIDIKRLVDTKEIYSIKIKDSNLFIGIFSLYKTNEELNEVEVGYALGYDYWNKGYMTEAFQSFIKYLFEVLKFKRVIASYFIENSASKKVMEKCNMKYFKTIENELKWHDLDKTVVYYEISYNNYLLNK